MKKELVAQLELILGNHVNDLINQEISLVDIETDEFVKSSMEKISYSRGESYITAAEFFNL